MPQLISQWARTFARTNVTTLLSGTDEYEYALAGSANNVGKAPSAAKLMRYRRANGTRNEIWILCIVGCVGRTAERIARLAAQKYAGRVDNVVAFPHQFGCSQLGGDLDRTRKLIAGLARHPNAGGVLILDLGCESNQLSKLLTEIPETERERIRYFAAQSTPRPVARRATRSMNHVKSRFGRTV